MIHMTGWISRKFPEIDFRMVQNRKPKVSPILMLYVKGIRMMIMKAETVSAQCSMGILVMFLNMKIPTTTNAGAVAYEGTIPIMGVTKRAARKRILTVKAVKPVRPPSSIPEADSM